MGTGVYTFHDNLLKNRVRLRFFRRFSEFSLPNILNPSNTIAEIMNAAAVNIDHAVSGLPKIRLQIIGSTAAAIISRTGISLKFILMLRKKLRIFAFFAG